MADASTTASGRTVAEVARLLRVGADKVRAWIRRGELAALNTADPGDRPRFVVLPDQLEAFRRQRAAAPPPEAKPARRRRSTAMRDYFP